MGEVYVTFRSWARCMRGEGLGEGLGEVQARHRREQLVLDEDLSEGGVEDLGEVLGEGLGEILGKGSFWARWKSLCEVELSF